MFGELGCILEGFGETRAVLGIFLEGLGEVWGGRAEGGEMKPQGRSKGANEEPQAAQRRPKGAKRKLKGRAGVLGARSKETRKEKNREEGGHGSKNANMQKT